MGLFCSLQEFKGTPNKRDEGQEGEVYRQVTGPQRLQMWHSEMARPSNFTAKWTPNSESE